MKITSVFFDNKTNGYDQKKEGIIVFCLIE